MTKLDLKEVKQTVSKLPLELINILLVDCGDTNCNLNPLDDFNNSRTTLKRNREKLVNYIVDSNAVATYNQAKDLANALIEYDDLIKAKEEEHAPIKAQYKEANAEIKQLKKDKETLIKHKVNELEKTLNNKEYEQITQYNSVIESENAKTKRHKQRTKALKELGKGFIASEIDGITEEFGEAINEVYIITPKFIEKLRKQIKENQEQKINLETVKGLNKVNEKFDREWRTHETNIINRTGLNPDWKKDQIASHLFQERQEPKQLMPAIDVDVIGDGDDVAIAA